jgi:cytolysin (calcineurin-like family phosphatase)
MPQSAALRAVRFCHGEYLIWPAVLRPVAVGLGSADMQNGCAGTSGS